MAKSGLARRTDYWHHSIRRQSFRLRHPKRFSVIQQKRRKPIDYDSLSYQPFDRYRALFVHIPKCGGVAVNHTLFASLAGGHDTLRAYCRAFEPACVQSYFKFTFVRNPWDRLVSAYHFLAHGGLNKNDRRWADQYLRGYANFDAFVRGWLTRENIWKGQHFKPQCHFLDPGKYPVTLDFVGRFENLAEDFALVAQRLNLNAGLARQNTSEHAEYRSYYTAETRDIVAYVYAEDIERFGYRFGD